MCANCADDSARGRAAVAEALRGARRLLVVTHARPDGDGLGSMLALCLAGAEAGRECDFLSLDPVPRRYEFLFEARPPAPAARFAGLAAAADRVVVVDTCALAQLEPIAEALRACREKVVVIDHHATADDIAPVVWRDESAAAAGVMVIELLDELGWPLTAPTAEALMTALCTDTGWLRYANTDSRVLAAAARLVDAGARPAKLFASIYQRDRPERLKLLAAALGSLELHADGRLAAMTLTRGDFDRTGASEDETEDFVNEPMRIPSVEVSLLCTAQADGQVRVSLRSRQVVDVAAVARGFGGGGHPRAAGLRASGGLADVAADVIAACIEALRAGGG